MHHSKRACAPFTASHISLSHSEGFAAHAKHACAWPNVPGHGVFFVCVCVCVCVCVQITKASKIVKKYRSSTMPRCAERMPMGPAIHGIEQVEQVNKDDQDASNDEGMSEDEDPYTALPTPPRTWRVHKPDPTHPALRVVSTLAELEGRYSKQYKEVVQIVEEVCTHYKCIKCVCVACLLRVAACFSHSHVLRVEARCMAQHVSLLGAAWHVPQHVS